MGSENDNIVVLILAECTDSVRFPNPNTNPAGRCEVTERSVITIFPLYIAHIIILYDSTSFTQPLYAAIFKFTRQIEPVALTLQKLVLYSNGNKGCAIVSIWEQRILFS